MADPSVLEKVPSARQLRSAYDLWSYCYDRVAAPWDHGPRLRGLDIANVQSGETVLDIAVGTGTVAKRLLAGGHTGISVFGADISLKMLAKAKANLVGETGACLLAADALALPFRDAVFDVVYSAYTLDLLTTANIALALLEFRRVLKPGGRIVLVNMSKHDASATTWFERFYKAMPTSWAAYVLGGCRPVILDGFASKAGFRKVRREFIRDSISSEIVTGRKP